jgi:hypothetical protein
MFCPFSPIDFQYTAEVDTSFDEGSWSAPTERVSNTWIAFMLGRYLGNVSLEARDADHVDLVHTVEERIPTSATIVYATRPTPPLALTLCHNAGALLVDSSSSSTGLELTITGTASDDHIATSVMGSD